MNGERAYVSAGIAKVDILAALLLQAQQEDRALTADEKTSASAMIRQSDNDAAFALWRALGGAPALEAANARLVWPRPPRTPRPGAWTRPPSATNCACWPR
ncbi:hypothetical protein [Streptodolium elevatio]